MKPVLTVSNNQAVEHRTHPVFLGIWAPWWVLEVAETVMSRKKDETKRKAPQPQLDTAQAISDLSTHSTRVARRVTVTCLKRLWLSRSVASQRDR